jgi:hypothetical protein
MLLLTPSSACTISCSPCRFRAEFAIERQVAAIEPGADRDRGALDKARLLHRGRRQFEPQHVAAAIETAAVEDHAAVAAIDARAGLGRRDQPPQHRRDPLRIDREIQPGRFVRRAVAFARLQVEQAVRVDGDGVGFDGGGRGNRAGDDFGLHKQALRARVDQAGAELREIENARHQGHEARQVERDDPAREAGEGKREEELPGPAQPAEWPPPALFARVNVGNAIPVEELRSILVVQAGIGLRSI